MYNVGYNLACLPMVNGEANFKVVLHLSNAIAHFFRQKDELCLDWIKHTQINEATLTSISSGWSTETEGPDQIKTKFD